MHSEPGKTCSVRHRAGPMLMALIIGAGWCSSAKGGLFDDGPSSNQRPPTARLMPTPAAGGTSPALPPAPLPPVAATQPSRLAVPAEPQQRAAEEQVKEVFGQRLRDAHTPDDCRKLAGMLLDTATQTSEADARFVLLRESENCAVLAGDVDAAFAARAALRSSFDISCWPPAYELFPQLDRIATSPEARRSLCGAMLAAACDSLGADQFASARSLAEQALAVARKLDDRDLSLQAGSSLAWVDLCQTEKKRIAPALALLLTKPDEPAANAAVGRYECLIKHHWSRGLPMLARGNDPALQMLAAGELENPTNPHDSLKVADGWWAYSETQSQALRPDIRLHAGMWYSTTVSGLSGLSKLKAEERSAEYEKSVVAIGVGTGTGQGGREAPSGKVAANSATAEPPLLPPANGNPVPPAKAKYNSLEEVLAAVPLNVLPETPADWRDRETNKRFADAFKAAFNDKWATCRLTISQFIPAGPKSTSALAITERYPVGKTKVMFMLHLALDDPHLADITPGTMWTVSGLLDAASWNPPGLMLSFHHGTITLSK